MDGFIVSLVDHGTTLAFSHSLRPPRSRLLNRQNEGPRKQAFLSALPWRGPAPHGNFPSALEELRLGQNSFPMTAKSKQKAAGMREGQGLSSWWRWLPFLLRWDSAETLYAPRNHRRVCVCVCVCVCLCVSVCVRARARARARREWGLGSGFVVRAAS